MSERTKPIAKGTLRYLESALSFFKKKYGLDSIKCDIKFDRYRDMGISKKNFKHLYVLGYYNILKNELVIEGCDYYSRNQLVETLFHELVHFWQARIAKKLVPVIRFYNQQVDSLFSDQSTIQDAYHSYPVSRSLYYDQIRTDDMGYWYKPHEIEARKLSKELFDEWNLPENKGKIV